MAQVRDQRLHTETAVRESVLPRWRFAAAAAVLSSLNRLGRCNQPAAHSIHLLYRSST